MDPRLADRVLPPTTPLKPKLLGRGLPMPPVAVLVGTVGLFIGLALGYGIAPKPSPPASLRRSGRVSIAFGLPRSVNHAHE